MDLDTIKSALAEVWKVRWAVAALCLMTGGLVWWWAALHFGERIEVLKERINLFSDKGAQTEAPTTAAPPPIANMATIEQLKPQHLKGLTFRLADLAAASPEGIKDRLIEDCIIHGPAIVAFLGRGHAEWNTFRRVGGAGSMFWELPDGETRMGVIPIYASTLLRNTFFGIAVAGTKAEIERFKAATER